MKYYNPMALVMSLILREMGGESMRVKPNKIDFSPKIPPIPKGCIKYVFQESFGTLEVIAISEKSAYKKYNKWCIINEMKKNGNAQ